MRRTLSMALLALLTTACVQVGVAPPGSAVLPPDEPSAATAAPGAPAPEPTRRRRPRPPAPASAAPTTAGLPDLVASDLSVPDTVTTDGPDQSADFKGWVTITNTGTAATGPFDYVVFLDGQKQDPVGESWTVPDLAPGASVTGLFELYTEGVAAGAHVIEVRLDPLGQIAESDEADNSATGEVTFEASTDPLIPPLP